MVRTLFRVAMVAVLSVASAAWADTRFDLGGSRAKDLAFVPGSPYVAAVLYHGFGPGFTTSLALYDATTARRVSSVERRTELNSLAVSSDGRYLAVAALHGGSPALELFRIERGQLVTQATVAIAQASVHGLAFLSDSRRLVFSEYLAGRGFRFRVYEVPTETLGAPLFGGTSLDVRGLQSIADNQFSSIDTSGNVSLWRLGRTAAEQVARLSPPTGQPVHYANECTEGWYTPTGGVAFSPNGRHRIALDPGMRELVLSGGDGRQRTLPEAAAAWVFTPSGDRVAFLSARGRVAVVELATGRLVGGTEVQDVVGDWSRNAISPDGRRLAIAGETAIHVVELPR